MNNYNFEALALTARTATVNSADFNNQQFRGCHVILEVTASAATPSMVLTLEGKDDVSGVYYTLLTGAAVTGASTNVYNFYPGITAAANIAVSDVLPNKFRVTLTHADADSITYSVGVTLIK